MNRNEISKGFQESLMAARIKSTFMLQAGSCVCCIVPSQEVFG